MPASSLVSVLIRTKNRRELLCEAVRSVAAQTHPAIEIVIVNDGGANHFADLPPFAGPERSLRWIDNTGAPGRSPAANLALEAARGQWCIFLDDDDWFDPPHLANLVAALDARPGIALAYSSTRTVSEAGSDDTSFSADFDADRLLIENYIPIHAALFARTLVERACRFDTHFDRYEDWDFWLQVLQHTAFVHVNECTANYRIASGSGFGSKQEEDPAPFRAALYRKWLPRLTDAQLLGALDRARAWPQYEVLRGEFATQANFVRLLQEQEKELNQELVRRADVMAQQGLRIATLSQELLDAENQARHSENQRQVAEETIAALRADLNLIYQSRSWKLTKPLRLAAKVQYSLQLEGPGGLWRRVKFKLFRKAPRLPVATAANPVAVSYKALEFPVHAEPLISIVIPVYNKFEYTYHCLESILANSSDQTYEVIVVDDCSSDITASKLAEMKGIRVIRNEQNGGFIHSCNTGALAARGKYLLLFNNDTEPQPLWLTALVNTFRDFPDCGMVGAKLLYPDGTLQEAGGIVWRDGSAWNYGRGDDPNKPEYSYARQVDYCSGACLLLPIADYLALGMFDTLYKPAYYEDTDLAFKVRAAGKKVYYQPLARVIHFEGVSNGTDLSTGVKEYQVKNHEKFFQRWETTLLAHRPNGRVPHYEKERHVQKRMMVVDARVLMPDQDSGSLRMFNLLRIFQRLGYKVSFLPDNLQYHEHYTPMLQALGIECFYQPYLHDVNDHLKYFGAQYQVILLSRADHAERCIDNAVQYCPQAQILFDTVDLHFLREQRLAELSKDRMLMEAANSRKLQELGIARKAHKTLVVSPVEIDLFRKEAPDVKVALLSNIHSVKGRARGFHERKDILFIGGFEHPPNVDAVHWFIDEIFPVLHEAKPELKVWIIGAEAPKSLTAKAGANVVFTGFVEDIGPHFDNIRLSIAPLRYGAGVKGKINSSMSYGVPVVGTTVAAEGMGLRHGEDILIADEPAAFARCIVRLYDDPALWLKLSDAGLANIDRHFSFELATQQLQAILEMR